MEIVESCQTTIIHEDRVNEVKAKFSEDEDLFGVSELFKVLVDYTRFRILYALGQAELCVCDIAAVLNMTQSAISHQLRILKEANLVKNRRDGKVVYYTLDDEHVKQIVNLAIIHKREV